MNWGAGDLAKEWKRFKQHCQFTFDGPLSEKTEKAKVNYLMTYVGDKGREVYETFDWTPAAEGQAREQEGVYAKFAHHVAPKTNRIRATDYEFFLNRVLFDTDHRHLLLQEVPLLHISKFCQRFAGVNGCELRPNM